MTGATSGIGAAIALALAAQGFALLLVGRRRAEGEALAEALNAGGTPARFVVADVSDRAAPDRIVQAALDAFGGVDVLINNAGILVLGRAEETSDADWDQVMDVNLGGVFRLSRAALPALRARVTAFLVSDAAEYMTGTLIPVDGGVTAG